MAPTVSLVIGSVLLVVCGFLAAARKQTLRRTHAILDLRPITPDATVRHRLVAVRGRVRASHPMPHPITQAPQAYVATRLLQHRASHHQVLVETENEAALQLDVNGHLVHVSTHNAEVAIAWNPPHECDVEPDAIMQRILESAECDPPPRDPHVRYTLESRSIAVGQTLTAIGTLHEAPEKVEGFQLHPSHGFLILSDQNLEHLARQERTHGQSMNRMLAIGLLVTCTAFGLALALSAFSA